jgi:Flp pilus assembly protein TadG
MKTANKGFLANESGGVAVYMALALVALLACAGLVLDIAHMVSVKRELVKAAEAGALAGARGLWPTILPSTSASRSPDCAAAQTWALHAATRNEVDGANLAVDQVRVEVGQWNYSTHQFTPGMSNNANGVRVTVYKSRVRTVFSKVIGEYYRNMNATAIAIMDFASAVGQGTLPLAINKPYTDSGTPIFINFTPDPYDNGGWFANPPDTANARTFTDYINNAACAPLHVGDIINLQNGNDTSCLDALSAKLSQQPEGYLDTLLPVVDASTFNQNEPIKGFVPFRITSVVNTGSTKGVWGTVISLTEMQTALPGGGGKYGGLAPPKLVQ